VIYDETWSAVCNSLKSHPTLEVLDLRATDHVPAPATTQVDITSRVQALLGMMKVNTSIHTMHLSNPYFEHELFRRSIVPYLETNRFRPRLLAIQKALPIPYRAKVLGRALLAARSDLNRFWMLISGNAEVAFPSTTATTTMPASLPTPVIAPTTSNAISPTAGAASTISVSAVQRVATPTRKRKSCPHYAVN
jgi:hypothetical protein